MGVHTYIEVTEAHQNCSLLCIICKDKNPRYVFKMIYCIL